MFSAWAENSGFTVYPGTLNLRSEEKLIPAGGYISLMPWEHLSQAASFRSKEGYSPRVYPAKLNGVDIWVFRWAEALYLENFVGDRPNCPKELFCEVVSRDNLKDALNIKDLDEVDLFV
jgi:CTP-dependent riboflavin kinase